MPTKLDGKLITDDLNLAALLLMRGYETTLQVKETGQYRASWMIEEVTDDLRDLVVQYKAGECRVEPRAYASFLTQTRRKMYKALGIDHRVPSS